jgi:hypothetical protein
MTSFCPEVPQSFAALTAAAPPGLEIVHHVVRSVCPIVCRHNDLERFEPAEPR